VTDRQQHIPRYAYASRGKNWSTFAKVIAKLEGQSLERIATPKTKNSKLKKDDAGFRVHDVDWP